MAETAGKEDSVTEREDGSELDASSIDYDQLIPFPSQPLRCTISDAGTYSYASLCSLAMHNLFDNDWDRPFCYQCLSLLIEHLGLPSQVEAVMKVIMEGQHPTDKDIMVKVLLDEPALQGKSYLVLEDLVLFAVQKGVYDSRMRVLICHVAWMLHVSMELVETYEDSVIDFLTEELHEETEEEKKESLRRQRNRKAKRFFMIGLATVGGGALLGLTGGLAAPFMAAGAGAIIGGAGAAVLGSTAGIAVIGSLFGVAGAGLTGFKMQKRVGAVEEFAFDYLTESNQLHITIAVSGWLTEDGPEFFKLPWRNLLNSYEQYCLRYESHYLRELGKAIDYLFSFAVTMAAQEALKYTILSGIITAIAWPASLLTLASVIDNPWSVCIRRSGEVGKLLADVLMSRQQGRRPVTLIGFSLGARVIFYCLQELTKRKGSEGIIEDAIMLGTPVSGNVRDWQSLSRVVAGRVINGYCRGDWLLKFLYRTSSVSLNIAGLHPVEWKDRRMHNIDLSDVVSGHMDYSKKMDLILKTIGVRTCDQTANVQSQLRKSRSQSPVRKLTHLGVPGMATSKSDGVLVEPGSDAHLNTSCRTASVSTADSGIVRTATDLSLSDVSSTSYNVSRDYLGYDSYDLALSQNSLDSSQSQSDSADFTVPSNMYKDLSLDSLYISSDCPLSSLPSSLRQPNMYNINPVGPAAPSTLFSQAPLDAEFKFVVEEVKGQPTEGVYPSTQKDNT